MSTRGLYGFVLDGEKKLAYNHFDSGPNGLGLSCLEFLRETYSNSIRGFLEQVSNLKVIDPESIPTDEEVAEYMRYANIGVASGALGDWYCLLRETQGDMRKTLDVGVIEDGSSFAADSVFCEYGYVANLDSGFFEIYAGFQLEEHSEGIFSDLEEQKGAGGPYYPIKLVAAYDLNLLPDEGKFLEDMDVVFSREEDEYSRLRA